MEIFRAKRGFSTHHPKTGAHLYVHEGETTEEGHWLLKQNGANFEPLQVTHPLPASPAPRGRGKDESAAETEKAAA